MKSLLAAGWLFGLALTPPALLTPHASTVSPPQAPSASVESMSSTWPQGYQVTRSRWGGRLVLSTPYYVVEHDLRRGGTLARIHLTHGQAGNLLVEPLTCRIVDEAGHVYTDALDRSPRVRTERDGLHQMVTVEASLCREEGQSSPLRLRTTYDYRWGYVKIHREILQIEGNPRVREISPVALVAAPTLTHYGYRDGLLEEDGAGAFTFGSCHWGQARTNASPAFTTVQPPRYVMFAHPGVEGFEWFASSHLASWDRLPDGRRGLGRSVLQMTAGQRGVAFHVSTFQSTQAPLALTAPLSFDFYLGWPLLEGHALTPWSHGTFNRNRGDWVTPDQWQSWTASGIQTVHCHNDGDYYGDGLFWKDGSYPPYPDMEKFDQVIAECHRRGIRVATYFSNKELHPSTASFQEHGTEWGRMGRAGQLQHNAYRPGSEFGAQMCLRSGWLNELKNSIDRVLTKHALDGVYYDWNVALACRNPRHEPSSPAEASAHWDIDELLDLMEWTRRRVGPGGLVIVHNTTTPMFAAENFANHIVANEWGYGKWAEPGPGLEELPLEWSLVGARSRGVISYGQLDAKASRRLYRLFALEALLANVTPWPMSREALELLPVLRPLGRLDNCRFADWRNQAVILEGRRCGSAVFSRKNEAFLLLANLQAEAQEVHCRVQSRALPWPLRHLKSAMVYRPSEMKPGVWTPSPVDAKQLSGAGLRISLPADSAVLLQLR